MSLDSCRLFQFAHFKFSNLKTVKSFAWTSSKFYKTWKMVFPVVPVVTELLRNDERLLFFILLLNFRNVVRVTKVWSSLVLVLTEEKSVFSLYNPSGGTWMYL